MPSHRMLPCVRSYSPCLDLSNISGVIRSQPYDVGDDVPFLHGHTWPGDNDKSAHNQIKW